jgi:hypothetical protein
MKIEYEIKNMSELISLTKLKNSFFKNNSNKYLIPLYKSGVYIFYNNKKEIIYVGRSVNCIKSRVFTQLFSDSSLNEDKKKYCLNDYESTILKREKTKYISFAEIEIKLVPFVEIGLICKFSPILNKQYNF